MGIGVSLKICEIGHVGIFTGEKFPSPSQLVGNAQRRRAVFRIEGLIVAIRTPPIALGPVAVRAAEACVDRQFLHLATEVFRKEIAVITIKFCGHGKSLILL